MTKIARSDEKWLDEHDLRELEAARAIFDLDGWAETPIQTFAGGHSAPYAPGEVTEEDIRVAAGIRERIWRAKGGQRA